VYVCVYIFVYYKTEGAVERGQRHPRYAAQLSEEGQQRTNTNPHAKEKKKRKTAATKKTKDERVKTGNKQSKQQKERKPLKQCSLSASNHTKKQSDENGLRKSAELTLQRDAMQEKEGGRRRRGNKGILWRVCVENKSCSK
jgi:hypothetical protein